MNTAEFSLFSRFAVNAALNAEIEYGFWSKRKSILDVGSEYLISTSVARAAAAFFGIGGDYSVLLECPLSRLTPKLTRGGRVDCAVFKKDTPLIIVECKRVFLHGKIEKDVVRCCEILHKKGDKSKCAAILVGLRRINAHDKKDKNEGARIIADRLSSKKGYNFEPFSMRRELEQPIHYVKNGERRTWTASVAQSITVTASQG